MNIVIRKKYGEEMFFPLKTENITLNCHVVRLELPTMPEDIIAAKIESRSKNACLQGHFCDADKSVDTPQLCCKKAA
jgi:hypothetical protein